MNRIPFRVEQDIPVFAETDVVVIGGGPGGISAAVTAARNGAKTVLVERYGQLGGMAGVGEVHPFMRNHSHHKTMDGPVYVDWIRAMRKYCAPDVRDAEFDPAIDSLRDLYITKEYAALAAEDLCLEAGVKLLFHQTVAAANVVDGVVQSVVLHSKSGFGAILGKVFIDSTGDGDLAALANCRFEFGNCDGDCQPMTTSFKLENVDTSRIPLRPELDRIYNEAKANGVVHCPRENLLLFPTLDAGVIHFNTTRVIRKKAIDALELSEAEIEARRQVREITRFLQQYMPGFEHAKIRSVAMQIGVRESRRIIGKQFLTVEAFTQARKCASGIARVSYPIDIHNPSGSGTVIRHIAPDDWYEIPYECILAADCKNLLIGSRCISVDHELHSSMRVMPPVCTIGQAAGMAAAVAVRESITPDRVDGVELRKALVAFGAPL